MEYNEVKHEKIISEKPNRELLLMLDLFKRSRATANSNIPGFHWSTEMITDELAKREESDLSHFIQVIVEKTMEKKAKLKEEKAKLNSKK